MSQAKQFIFGDPQAWIKGIKPCGLRKAVKQATGTICFVYERGDLVKTFDVRELFEDYLVKRGWNRHYLTGCRTIAGEVKATMKSKQDQNNKLLQKIRKLI